MAENVIVAEDGSLIPTGDTQVEQVGEAAHDADEAGNDLDTIVGGADENDTFALPGDRAYQEGDVVDLDSGDTASATATDTTSTDTPPTTSDGVGDSVRRIIVPDQSSGGLSTGLLGVVLAVIVAAAALLGGD
jgi:hypothetical protein